MAILLKMKLLKLQTKTNKFKLSLSYQYSSQISPVVSAYTITELWFKLKNQYKLGVHNIIKDELKSKH